MLYIAHTYQRKLLKVVSTSTIMVTVTVSLKYVLHDGAPKPQQLNFEIEIQDSNATKTKMLEMAA